MSIELQKFQGGAGTMTKFGVAGIVSLIIGFVGFAGDRKAALFSYLVAFAFWAGIALGSLILLMIFHTFRAKWMVVLRRPLEAMATTLPLFLLLALPILFFLADIYSWVTPTAAGGFNPEEVKVLAHKASYLNGGAFIVRTIFYFLFASVIGWRLFGLSTRQDVTGDVALTQKQRNLGIGGLPFVGLVITFAAFDWLMSLNPTWFSTVFGVYYFAGAMWATIAILIIASTLARGKDQFGSFVSVEHMHNLGKLLLTFTCFWTYIAFSQLMLIWIANLPEEISFYMVRFQGDWVPVGIALLLGHFVLPFALLLSRDLKRTPKRLSLVAVWALLMNLLDVYWLVMPSLDPMHARLTLTLPFAWIGMGCLAVAFTLWKIRGHYQVPVKDPFLDVSLRYRQPT